MAMARRPGAAAGDDDRAVPRYAETDSAAARRDFARSAGWTLGSAIIPGLGLLPTRARRIGLALIGLAVLAAVALAVAATTSLGSLASVAVRPGALKVVGVLVVLLALGWVAVITATHLLTRPRPASGLQRGLGAVLVGLLSFMVSAPLIVGANYARDQASLVNGIFKGSGSTRSQTRPTLANGSDPFAGKDRLNILLLGGDNTAARDKLDPNEGIRTDTVMMASVDLATGNMALIQLPRNLEAFPFPSSSALAKAYPQGYWTGQEGDRENPEFELNSVWDNVPRDHPELFKDTDYPNADAVKFAVEGITGMRPDYFAMLSIEGLMKLIDAVGGVTVNVNDRLPIAQTTEQAEAGIPPKGGYIEIGPNQHLNGYKAMWYARSRSQSKDPDRMARQGCVVKALVDQADPQTVLTRYEAIANAGKNAVVTDIPQEVAPALIQLALKMKDAKVQRVLFGYPGTKYLDGTSFQPWNPDIPKMQALIANGIQKSMGVTPSPSPEARSTATATATKAATTAPAEPTGSPSSSAPKAEADLSDACAYHPSNATPSATPSR